MSDVDPLTCHDLRFWRELVAGAWERDFAVFSGAAPEGLGSVRDVFEGLVQRSTAGGPYDAMAPLKLYRGDDGEALHLPDEGRPELAPRPEDGDLDGYLRRLIELTGEPEIGFIVNHVHALHPEIHRRVQAMLDVALEVLPFPSGGATSAAFFGTYRRTQVGIHCDNMNVFVAPVMGRKTFYLWSRQALASHPAVLALGDDASASKARIPRVSVDEIASLGHRVEVGPGDLLYIPKGMWHVACPRDELNVSFHVTLLSREPPLAGFEELFDHDGEICDLLPSAERARSRSFLAWRSAQGLLAWPPLASAAPSSSSLVCVAPRGSRLTTGEQGLEVVAGGRVLPLGTDHPRVHDELSSVLSGRPFTADEHPAVHEVVRALTRMGVVSEARPRRSA